MINITKYYKYDPSTGESVLTIPPEDMGSILEENGWNDTTLLDVVQKQNSFYLKEKKD
jgi:hypothetical protein